MDEESPVSTVSALSTGKRRRRAIYTAALAGGLVLGGFGVAAAQTDTPSTTTPPTTVAPDPGGGGDAARPHLRMRGPGGPGGPGMMGARGAIRGELTVPDGNGGYRTMLVQRGEVTKVSSSSVTVKSDDGYEKTYAVDDNTLVNAGNEGISDVKTGDKVNVQGFVEGSTARAARVMDETGVGAIRDRWRPKSA